MSNEELIQKWGKVWDCLFKALDAINDDNFNKPILIRNKEVKIIESITRQIAHYPYHIEQIVFIVKMILNEKWNSLPIPKGKSEEYIQREFEKNLKITSK